VEALRDIEASIERNDNRLPFRSRELLNSDRAARGTSLARIYGDLGLDQLAVDEAARSLALDPASPSAHRFLADTYATQRRNEIGRVSELLQAQLFQDININPVQPSLSVTGLDIFSGGPFRIGLNEYTPLFERNRAQLNLTGQVGNNNTWANEAVVSGVYDWFSISGGQFYYTSDGFRRNADITNSVYNLFTQAALSPQVNVQAEFLSRDTNSGDRTMNFEPDQYKQDLRLENNEQTARLGARLSPGPNTHVLTSLIYSNVDFNQTERTPAFVQNNVSRNDNEGFQYENQLTHLYRNLSFIAGYGLYNINSDFNKQKHDNISGANFYSYNNLQLFDDAIMTVGLSVDRYSSDTQDEKLTNVNPKIGLQWNIFDGVQLTGAVFRTLKRDFVANRTIEPTQVAGFDQFYDDYNGTDAWNYAAGLNARLTRSVYVGSETVIRRLDVPQSSSKDWEWDEDHYRGYVHWTPIDSLVLSSEVLFDTFESGGRPPSQRLNPVPNEVNTLTVPLGLRYFSPLGFIAGTTINLVHQRVEEIDVNGPTQNIDSRNSNFFTLDALLGYRLPERRGIILLEGINLLNKDFDYQDDNFQSPLTGNGKFLSPFIPERTILFTVSLAF
jgi:hypothetical protein